MSVDFEVEAALDVIAESVQAKRCILFLGAGVHAPPPAVSPFVYPAEHRPPVGAALSQELARRCELARRFPNEDPKNLQRVSLFYEISRSRRQLADHVRESVETGRKPSPMLHALAELGFPIVITTNYDHLFEQALEAAGRPPRVITYTHELEKTVDHLDPTPESPVVFKIHGDVDRRETIVITDEDYIDFALRMNSKPPYDPIPLTIKRHLTDWTTVFVGYSLLDYNLRLLFKTLRWKIDTANLPDVYSIDFRPDPLIFDVYHLQRRYVRFISQNVWAFVPRLYQLVLQKELVP